MCFEEQGQQNVAVLADVPDVLATVVDGFQCADFCPATRLELQGIARFLESVIPPDRKLLILRTSVVGSSPAYVCDLARLADVAGFSQSVEEHFFPLSYHFPDQLTCAVVVRLPNEKGHGQSPVAFHDSRKRRTGGSG